MTKFEELMDLIGRNNNKNKSMSVKHFTDIGTVDEGDIELEVSGSDSTRAPLVASANEELDPDIIDMLYTKPRHKPNDGFGASAWDSDY